MFNHISRFLIKVYSAVISPMIGKNCRFHPTCSAYAHEAFENHGFFRALGLTIWRILRCNPFYKGSRIDPVPPCASDAEKSNS